MIAELGRGIRVVIHGSSPYLWKRPSVPYYIAAFIYWLTYSIFTLDKNVNVSDTEI